MTTRAAAEESEDAMTKRYDPLDPRSDPWVFVFAILAAIVITAPAWGPIVWKPIVTAWIGGMR